MIFSLGGNLEKIIKEKRKNIKNIYDDDIKKFMNKARNDKLYFFLLDLITLFKIINIDEVFFKTIKKDREKYSDFAVFEGFEIKKDVIFVKFYFYLKLRRFQFEGNGSFGKRIFKEEKEDVEDFLKEIDENKGNIDKVAEIINFYELQKFKNLDDEDIIKRMNKFLNLFIPKLNVYLKNRIKNLNIKNIDDINFINNVYIKIIKISSRIGYKSNELDKFFDIEKDIREKKKFLLDLLLKKIRIEKKGNEVDESEIENLISNINLLGFDFNVIESKLKEFRNFLRLAESGRMKDIKNKKREINKVYKYLKSLNLLSEKDEMRYDKIINKMLLKNKKDNYDDYEKIEFEVNTEMELIDVLKLLRKKLYSSGFSAEEISFFTGGVL